MKPALKAPGTNSLKLNYDEPLSNFAFNCNLRRYTMVSEMGFDVAASALGRGLHSFPFQLNLTCLCPPYNPT